MNTITEMKTTLEAFDSILDKAEKWISKLEDEVAEYTQLEHKKKKEF